MPNTFTAPNDQLMIDIYTTAADSIVAHLQRLNRRARVRWTPALANDIAAAEHSRDAFIAGMPSDDANRVAWRAALIADAERCPHVTI